MRIYPKVDHLIGLIGLPAALKLVECFGGVSIYMPHPSRVRPDLPIALAIGLGPARALAAQWPQEELAVPRAAKYLRIRRNLQIRAEAMTVREIAMKYGLTMRTVERIRSGAVADETEPPATAVGVKPRRNSA